MKARLEETDRAVAVAVAATASAWSPFRYATFTVIWTATVVVNIGTWMYNAASGWLMTSLDPDPLIVSLVQVANNLPMFLFALPAGALADIIDKRKFLIVAETLITALCAIFAALVSLDLVTPGTLLLFTFLICVGGALTAPAWQSIVPQLVPKQHLPPAIAANRVGVNISRAVGPALGGVMTAGSGIGFSGWLSDKLQKRKSIALAGYLLAAIAKPLIGLSTWLARGVGRPFPGQAWHRYPLRSA
jgi:MFS family permease